MLPSQTLDSRAASLSGLVVAHGVWIYSPRCGKCVSEASAFSVGVPSLAQLRVPWRLCSTRRRSSQAQRAEISTKHLSRAKLKPIGGRLGSKPGSCISITWPSLAFARSQATPCMRRHCGIPPEQVLVSSIASFAMCPAAGMAPCENILRSGGPGVASKHRDMTTGLDL